MCSVRCTVQSRKIFRLQTDFLQDSIEKDDLVSVLEKVSEGKYEFYFQNQDDSGGGGGRPDSRNKKDDKRSSRNRSKSRDRGGDRGRSKSRDGRRSRAGSSRRNSPEDRGASGGGARRGRRRRGDDDDEEDKGTQTAIAWNREKYSGSPLQLGDDRLSEWNKWLRQHNLTVVRLVRGKSLWLNVLLKNFIS